MQYRSSQTKIRERELQHWQSLFLDSDQRKMKKIINGNRIKNSGIFMRLQLANPSVWTEKSAAKARTLKRPETFQVKGNWLSHNITFPVLALDSITHCFVSLKQSRPEPCSKRHRRHAKISTATHHIDGYACSLAQCTVCERSRTRTQYRHLYRISHLSFSAISNNWDSITANADTRRSNPEMQI